MFHKKTFHFTATVSYRALLATEILEQSMPQLPRAACHPTRKLIDLFDIAMEHILADTSQQQGSLSSETTRWAIYTSRTDVRPSAYARMTTLRHKYLDRNQR